jgi:hypothetical protein
MNDSTKSKPYVCHVPNKKLKMSVTLEGMPPEHFQEPQQRVFKQAVFTGMTKFVSTMQPIHFSATMTLKTKKPPMRREFTFTEEQAEEQATRRGSTYICKSRPPPGQPAWKNCFGLSVKVQCNQAKGLPYFCRWTNVNAKKPKALPICKECSSYAFMQVGYSQYCQDSANKCWSASDCTGGLTKCQVGKPKNIPTCCSSLCSNSTGYAPLDPEDLPPSMMSSASAVAITSMSASAGSGSATYSSGSPKSGKSSITVKFEVDLKNVKADIYDQASTTINTHFGFGFSTTTTTTTTTASASASASAAGASASASASAGGRRLLAVNNGEFLPQAQAMATAQGVSFPVTSVKVDTPAGTYAEYCSSAGSNCNGKKSSSDSSSSSNAAVIAVVVVLCVLAVVGIIAGGAYWHVSVKAKASNDGGDGAVMGKVSAEVGKVEARDGEHGTVAV